MIHDAVDVRANAVRLVDGLRPQQHDRGMPQPFATAPRFHAYFGRVEGRSVLTMERATWDRLKVHEGHPVDIDLELTPLRGVVRDASVVAATAQRSSAVSSEIEIVRHDPADAPTPYNVDRYTVWEDMASHQSFAEIVRGASTADNANLRAYMAENVFLVQQDPGPDHWLPHPPSSVTTTFTSS